jgi:hypothetical protein
MTRPRIKPDRPRVTPDECAWVIAAKAAGATIWQCAVFVQRKADTLYRVVARAKAEPPAPRKRRNKLGLSMRDVARKERSQFRRETKGCVFRCPYCRGASSDQEGHSLCIARHRSAA